MSHASAWRSPIRLRLLLLKCFAIFIFSASSVSAASYQARGVRAIDGDSIVVRLGSGATISVRLLSIDAPERGQPMADTARRFLDRRVRGRTLQLVSGQQERDRYGRLLAFVISEGLLLNEQLVADGLACAYIIPPNTLRADVILQAQQRAHAQSKGIWSVGMEDPRSYRARRVRPAASPPRALVYEERLIIANRKSRVAHWPGCRHFVSPQNRIAFSSAAAAASRGYRLEKGFK